MALLDVCPFVGEDRDELITTQRSFQAGSRLITVSDSVLEDIVNLKRS